MMMSIVQKMPRIVVFSGVCRPEGWEPRSLGHDAGEYPRSRSDRYGVVVSVGLVDDTGALAGAGALVSAVAASAGVGAVVGDAL